METTFLPVVKYGTDNFSLNMTSSAKSISYLEGYGHHHHAEITDLVPAMNYFYQCGSLNGEFSEVLNFTSAPPPSHPVAISVYGDHGYLSATVRKEWLAQLWEFLRIGSAKWDAIHTRNRLIAIQDSVNMFWHLGDISYADDTYLHSPFGFLYEEVYNNYMNWMQPIMSSKPYMTLPGNHEMECHSPVCMLRSRSLGRPLANFSAYNARFHMPARASLSSSNMWYSFNLGRAHLVAFNTETDFDGAAEETKGGGPHFPAGSFALPGEQLAWLEVDLQAANTPQARALRPWLIVGGHRPIYDKEYLQGDPVQQALEGLLTKYKVDLYICGHKHEYFRTFPVFEGTHEEDYDKPSKPVFVVVGGAGNEESDLSLMGQKRSTWEAIFGKPKEPAWLAASNRQYSTGILEIPDKYTLAFKLISSVTGSILDKFTITK
mmetsp:Transcript_8792/g.11923  ORF Transcript_8792/g.11923 Transcript_8792/m.11923 type:complete len:433 (+) Transcript_8792:179-1477(+)